MLTIFARRLAAQRIAFRTLAETRGTLFSTTTTTFKKHHPDHQQEQQQQTFDVDDYDHRSLQDKYPLASKEGLSKTAEQTIEDIDDYDHRSLYTNRSYIDTPKRRLLGGEDFVNRSKWAIGNLTTEDILKEEAEEKQVKAEEEAKKKHDDDIRHHAWYG